MTHPLERFEVSKSFTAKEFLAESITSLLARMADVASTIGEEHALSKVIASWRQELFFIRTAIEKL